MNAPPMPPPAVLEQISRRGAQLLSDDRLERLEAFQREMLGAAELAFSLTRLGPAAMGAPGAREKLAELQAAQQRAAEKVGLPPEEIQVLLVFTGQYYGRRMAVAHLTRQLEASRAEVGSPGAPESALQQQIAKLSQELDAFAAQYGPAVLAMLKKREDAFIQIQTEFMNVHARLGQEQSTSASTVDWN